MITMRNFILPVCKSKEETTSTGSDLSAVTSTDFVAPENYATVLHVTINPEIKLYLDEQGSVLAVELLNDDAKVMKNEVTELKGSLEDVIDKIIIVSNDDSFVKDNAIINFEITVVKNKVINTESILNKAKDSAAKSLQKIGKTAEIKTSVAENTVQETTPSDNAESNLSKPAETSKPNTTSKPTASSSHTHSYSSATCTEPAKCSCGATNSNALGHKWQEATCKAPKTCSVCKITEGSTAAHNYVNGKCTVCGDSLYLNPKTSIPKNTDYYSKFKKVGNLLESPGITFGESIDINGTAMMTRMYEKVTNNEDLQNSIVFGGEHYISSGAGYSPCSKITVTDTELIMEYESYKVKFAVQKDKTLIVLESNDSSYPKGAILTSDEKEALKG